MDFTEPEEHQDLRVAVAAVTQRYGSAYFAERAATGEPTTELWQELGAHGFIGINFPEQYGAAERGWQSLRSCARRRPLTVVHYCCCWSPARSRASC
ncbi:hypothetical protein MSAR_01730 [Mycolicibacterium sarraceniae]|uniref:Acyl-CoA dehydrogenase/oxidase N-terminal domain-containing protein n=1 Tax=Mycolicibacterium sarraceniae TaxID=1534348 RepID=A0A7I7SJB1_9MYCO|nr:hypothetical protein MSAR_01730 [Mycolicibacterium sarraceniae]